MMTVMYLFEFAQKGKGFDMNASMFYLYSWKYIYDGSETVFLPLSTPKNDDYVAPNSESSIVPCTKISEKDSRLSQTL